MNMEIGEKLKRLDELTTRASSISASLSRGGSTVASDIAQDVARMTNRVSMMLMDLEKRLGEPHSEEHENMLANMGPMINGLESMLDSLQSLVDKSPHKRQSR